MMDPYEELANAIIIQAAKDYSAAGKALKKTPGSMSDMNRKLMNTESTISILILMTAAT